MHYKPSLLIVLYFCLNIFGLKAQEYVASLQHYQQEDGLVYRAVATIYQDSRGFMWFGTAYGISRFDGYNFKNWTEEQGLFSDRIGIRIEDSEGYLWLISEEYGKIINISLLHVETGELLSFAEKFGTTLPFKLEDLIDRFIAAPDGRIYFVDNKHKTLIAYHHQEGFNTVPLAFQGDLELVYFSPPNSIWGNVSNTFSANSYYIDTLVKINITGETLYQYPHDGNLGVDKFFLKEKQLWYYERPTYGNGHFYRIDENGKQWTYPLDSLLIPTNLFKNPRENGFLELDYLANTETILAMRYGRLMIIHPDKGIMLELNEQFAELRADGVIGERGYFQDDIGRSWMGGNFGAYLLDIQKSPFKKYLYKEPSRGNADRFVCRAIMEFEDEIYVATQGPGLIKLTEGENKFSKFNQFLVANNSGWCWSMALDQQDNFYTGCFPYFYQINKKTNQIKRIPTVSEIDMGVWTVYDDRNGKLWLGDNQGLKTLDPKENIIRLVTDYGEFGELAKGSIYDIRADKEGTIWLSTNKGFYILDIEKGITAHYWSGGQADFFLPTDHIRHFYQDKAGIFWIATGGDGLIRWDKIVGTYQQFTISDGLSSNILNAVYEDDYNKLWLSSARGIIEFDKKSFMARSFLPKQGITHEEFLEVAHYQAKDGTIYFGGLNGVTAFHPKDFQQTHTAISAPLQVTEFAQFDGKTNQLLDKTGELMQTQKITLQPNDRYFQLQFALLTYEEVDKIRYAYKIDGIDEDWQEQKENTLRFSRLPYGTHLLHVKGKAADGQWSQKELQIPITVIKPFYLQFWFIGLALSSLLFGIYRIYQFSLTRQLEKAETRRIKELEVQKSRLFTNITHEIRTPLTVIQGMAAIFKDSTDLKYQEAGAMIRRNTQNLLNLINQILDVSKLESGNLKLNYIQADIIPYLMYLAESFQSYAATKNISLTVYSEVEQVLMDYDEDKLHKILSNLLINAIKFTPKYGKVIVHLNHVEQKNKSYLQIKVSDNGEGIDAKHLPYIFDRFYQIDDSSTRKGEGTGIGLTLVKELINLMNGTIDVKSRLEKGTEFKILLPILQQAIISENKPYPTIPKLGISNEFSTFSIPARQDDVPLILLIEDNQDVITYLKTCLQDHYQLATAKNGQTGIEKALSLIPDIIVSDVMMPKKDGFEVTQLLKTNPLTSHIPIILLTAKATQNDKLIGLEKGADVYLTKPFDKAELLIRIEKLIELRQLLQAKNIQQLNTPSIKKEQKDLPFSKDAFLQKLYELIVSQLDNSELKAQTLSFHFDLSERQFYRKLKAATNQSPLQFILHIRLQKAKELLLDSSLTISEIAYMVGFNDPNYFSRAFFKAFQQSPSDFRK